MFSKEANKVKITVEDIDAEGKPIISTFLTAGFLILNEVQYIYGTDLLRNIELHTNFRGRPNIVDILESAKLQLYIKPK